MTDRARPSIDELGRALAEPMRLRILRELLGGASLPAGALAARIGVAPSTVSAHLSRLEHAGLIQVEKVGRARRARLFDTAVAETIEGVLRLSGEDPTSSLSEHRRRTALRRARSCYDHLAGVLGIGIADLALARGWITDRDGSWSITCGTDVLSSALGVPVELPASSRPVVRACLDWTERRPHIAGGLGAAIFDGLLQEDWLRRRRGDRGLTVTPRGRHNFSVLGLDAS